MRDTNQQSEITEQEIDEVIAHRRPKSQQQQQNQRPPSLCELARTAFCQNEGWVKTNERLVGGGIDFIEELSTHDIVCMGLDLLPQPTIAKQKMLVFAQESFCTSKWADQEHTIVRLDHPSNSQFYLEVNVDELKVERGRWYDIDVLRSLLLPSDYVVRMIGDRLYKVIVNDHNWVEIDLNVVDCC